MFTLGYTLSSEEMPPHDLVRNAFGRKSASLAGRIADGFVSTRPDPDAIGTFRQHGGGGKPLIAGVKVCWADDVDTAGFDEIYVHQIGPDQEGFFRFYEREILPALG